ncbi:hypothetical protein F5X99DRAFT_412388 [Biscogniauxia marginata]|nr:hypothetical protein F5X99DRAFT_412388 [Biscogniauxia marginata]
MKTSFAAIFATAALATSVLASPQKLSQGEIVRRLFDDDLKDVAEDLDHYGDKGTRTVLVGDGKGGACAAVAVVDAQNKILDKEDLDDDAKEKCEKLTGTSKKKRSQEADVPAVFRRACPATTPCSEVSGGRLTILFKYCTDMGCSGCDEETAGGYTTYWCVP